MPVSFVHFSGCQALASEGELRVRRMISFLPFFTGLRPKTFRLQIPLYFMEFRPVRLFFSLLKTGMFFCLTMKLLPPFTHSQRSSVDGKDILRTKATPENLEITKIVPEKHTL